MSRRLRAALALFAIGILGFILGVIANVIYYMVLPALFESFPNLLTSSWLLWGLSGALAAIVCCLIYVYVR